MKVEFLIIGQGISGTWLTYYLQKAKKSFLVIDNNQTNSASRIAAGIINPVTGRRIVKTWMIDELLSYLVPAYEELGRELGISAITQKNIIDFHPTPQMKLAFDERLKEKTEYIIKPEDQNQFHQIFNYDFGFGVVNPVYIVNLKELLHAWRKKLSFSNQFLEEDFQISQLKISEFKLKYKDISAEKIIFCNGVEAIDNPYFKNLPFAPNKGEALIIESDQIPSTHIYKKGMMLAPVADNFFWLGSNYLWEFSDVQPTEQFRKQTEQLLKTWIKVPYKISDHFAGIRPANVERRPFVGFHPVYKNIGILNGFGTKGCSLAPYFAKEFADSMFQDKKLLPEINIDRFARTLKR